MTDQEEKNMTDSHGLIVARNYATAALCNAGALALYLLTQFM